jgi:hypothetical protein
MLPIWHEFSRLILNTLKMKRVLYILSMFFILSSFTVEGNADEIIANLKNNKASEVTQHFDDMVDFTIPGNEEIQNMSKNQSAVAFLKFIADNNLESFDLSSQREAGNTMYIAGKLTGSSKNYNLTILLKQKDGKHIITSIRIS